MPSDREQAPLVDSHVHLDRYPPDAVGAMLRRAAQAGVTRLLTVGVDLPTSRAALQLAGRWPAVLAAVGGHPTRLAAVASIPDRLDGLRRLLDAGPRPAPAGRAVAIGEVGLDDAAADPAGQAEFLDGCLELAAERDLPLVLHVVGRRGTHLAALESVSRHPTVRTVAHYFVGDPDLARHYLDAGCWIAVGKPVTRASEPAVREAVRIVPPGRLLLETDTYPLPGRATEPRDVAKVCASVAALTGRTYQEIAASTSAAFGRLLTG